jgi:hypothetical protein
MTRIVRIGVLAAIFGAGYLAGTLSQPSAQAQLDNALKSAGKAAAGSAAADATGSAGALGQAAKLGSTITDMQASVDSLQKNLEVLNTIKAALGG